jgi:hypothetical protein
VIAGGLKRTNTSQRWFNKFIIFLPASHLSLLKFTAAFGLSLSAGISGGVTITDDSCINNLEGVGSSAGSAYNIVGVEKL